MGFYDKFILPRVLDLACSAPPMKKLRNRYVSVARGKVLEMGIGSGLNLKYYGSEVQSITGVDPALELTNIAQKRVMEIDKPVDIIGVSGEQIPCADDMFDSVVCTWTLCSIPNPQAAVQEMRRILKPDGKIIFVEHGLADDQRVAKWQRRVEPFWKPVAGGCHLTRRADTLLKENGFSLDQFESGYEQGPKFATFMMHGIASVV